MQFTTLQMAWRNLWRNRKRTILAWAALAVAQIGLIWLESYIGGYRAKIFDAATGPMLGHVQIHVPKYLDDMAIDRTIPQAQNLLTQIASQDLIKSVSPRIYAPAMASLREAGHVANVIGIDFKSESTPSGLLDGIVLGDPFAANEIWIGKNLAQDMGVNLGDSLALIGQASDGSAASGLYRVVKIVQTRVDSINRSGVLMPLATAQDFLVLPDQIHEVILYSKDSDKIPQLVQNLQKLPSLAKLEILPWDKLIPQLESMLEIIRMSNIIVLVLAFLTTSAGIANTMLMATFERVHEFGTLLSLGCAPSRLIKMIFVESIILGFFGAIIGSIIGVIWVTHQAHFGIDLGALGGVKGFVGIEGTNVNLVIYPEFSWTSVRDGVIAVLATSVLASIWPAFRIAKLQPTEAVRA